MRNTESRIVNRLLKYSKASAIRKQVGTLFFKGGIVIMGFTIAGAVCGQLAHTSKLYGIVPGIVTAVLIVIFKGHIFFTKEIIRPLRLLWLMKRREQNKNDPKRVGLIHRTEKIIESE